MIHEGKNLILTESELEFVVNESVKNVLLTEVGNMAGIRNAANGLMNGKFNVKKSFQTGKQAQTFQKYFNNAQKSIAGMQQVLNNSNQPDIAQRLQQVNGELLKAANGFQQRAAQASGRQQVPANNTNTNVSNNGGNVSNNGGNLSNNGGNRSVARTIPLNGGQNFQINRTGQQQGAGDQGSPQLSRTGAAAQAGTQQQPQGNPTTSTATKVGRGVGNAAAGVSNFVRGVRQGYRNKVRSPKNNEYTNHISNNNREVDPTTGQYVGGAPTANPYTGENMPETKPFDIFNFQPPQQQPLQAPQQQPLQAPQPTQQQPLQAPQQKRETEWTPEMQQMSKMFNNGMTDNDISMKPQQQFQQEPPQQMGNKSELGIPQFKNGMTANDNPYESKRIRLTQNDLRKLVTETINILLREEFGPGSPGGGFAGGSETPVGSSNAQISSDAAYDVPGSFVKKDDKTLSRPKGDVAMNKSEKPVGHKG